MSVRNNRSFSKSRVVKRFAVSEHLDRSKGIFNPEEVSMLYPVDPRYGRPTSDLSRIANPQVSNAERESILSRLTKLEGQYIMPKDLSDKEILDLVPTRYYSNDPVDVQQWRQYLQAELFPNMDKDTLDALAGSEENNPQKSEDNE